MSKYRKLTHVYFQCDYHIVFTPKYRFRILEGMIKSLLEHYIQLIGSWKDVRLLEFNVQIDHIPLVCSIPPKISVSEYMGVLKGKMAIKLFKTYPNLKQKPYWRNHFWSRGCFVSTVGLDQELIKKCVKYQEKQEKTL